jgi:hypothetical protein
MDVGLKEHFEKALDIYTQGVHYDTLLEAKKEYFEITGQANDDDNDFEARMSSFIEWYVLQFISKRGTRTVISDYLIHNPVNDFLAKSLTSVNYSLFEYVGKNFRGYDVLFDMLHDKKIPLPKNGILPSIIKDDLFVGRTLSYEGKNNLMTGLCVIPKDVRSILKKECKKVRNLKNPNEELKFLLKIESFKTKWIRYGHVDATKIFKFS